MKRVLIVAGVLVAVSACGSPEAAAPLPLPPSASASGSALDCGVFVLDQGESVPAAAGRCLLEALAAGQPARLRVTSPTTEGDPIPTTYTTRPDGRVDVVVDTRQDQFGPRSVTRQTCAAPVLADRGLELGDCSDPLPA